MSITTHDRIVWDLALSALPPDRRPAPDEILAAVVRDGWVSDSQAFLAWREGCAYLAVCWADAPEGRIAPGEWDPEEMTLDAIGSRLHDFASSSATADEAAACATAARAVNERARAERSGLWTSAIGSAELTAGGVGTGPQPMVSGDLSVSVSEQGGEVRVSGLLDVFPGEDGGDDGVLCPSIQVLPIDTALDGALPLPGEVAGLAMEDQDDEWEAWFGNDAPALENSRVTFHERTGDTLRITWTATYVDRGRTETFRYEGEVSFPGVTVHADTPEEADRLIDAAYGRPVAAVLERICHADEHRTVFTYR